VSVWHEVAKFLSCNIVEYIYMLLALCLLALLAFIDEYGCLVKFFCRFTGNYGGILKKNEIGS
jgi:hypothetical protein